MDFYILTNNASVFSTCDWNHFGAHSYQQVDLISVIIIIIILNKNLREKLAILITSAKTNLQSQVGRVYHIINHEIKQLLFS